MDWEIFRPDMERIDQKVRKSAAGCKPTCRVLMFKLLILQRLYGLSDERLEYQVRDRLSFMRFLGLDLAEKVPRCAHRLGVSRGPKDAPAGGRFVRATQSDVGRRWLALLFAVALNKIRHEKPP